MGRATVSFYAVSSRRKRGLARFDRHADKLTPVIAHRFLGRQRAAPDEFEPLLAARLPHAEIARHGRPVGVLAGDDVALLGPQDHQRLYAHRRDAEILASPQKAFPE